MVLRHYLPQDEPSLVHLIMAIGIMPLIMGAMIYFTPVLTHSRTAGWLVLMVPPLALIAGTLASTGLLWRRDLLPIPAVLAMVAASTLLVWMWYRARTMLGRPHPGLNWYRWALACLLLGLIAILVAMFWPEHWMALRRFHLHINLLGFVGMTAFGTLCVLVPTVAGYADPDARPFAWRSVFYSDRYTTRCIRLRLANVACLAGSCAMADTAYAFRIVSCLALAKIRLGLASLQHLIGFGRFWFDCRVDYRRFSRYGYTAVRRLHADILFCISISTGNRGPQLSSAGVALAGK
jgi:hypothetical protein